ncbi:hypothetical protein DTO271G3_3832 [Paecilomyces variotii]|nr:hypothetical protein DTO271G3_3832 [Paecilomyces variotii]
MPAESSKSQSSPGWTFFPPLPDTGDTYTQNPAPQSTAATRLQPGTDDIQPRKQAGGTSHVSIPVNTRVTGQTSLDISPINSINLSDIQQKSTSASQGSKNHSQGPEVHHGELNESTVGQSRVNNLPKSPKDCQQMSTPFHKNDPLNPLFSGSQQNNSPALPYASSGPSLTRSFESRSPRDLAMQPSYSCPQLEYNDSHEHSPFPERETHLACKQSAESFSDPSLDYLSKGRTSSIGDGATYLPTIIETPYEDINKSNRQMDHSPQEKSRGNSRQMVGQFSVTMDELQTSRSDRKQADVPIPKSESGYRFDSRLDAEKYSSNTGERYISPSASQSGAHKDHFDFSINSTSSHDPKKEGERSEYLEGKNRDPVDQCEGSHGAGRKPNPPPRTETRKPPNSVKAQTACVPQTQTQIKIQVETQHAPAPPLRKELLPPWAVGSTALSRN